MYIVVMQRDGVINNYFVDEAGDMTLFNKRGSIVVGKSGVSNVFMLGVAKIEDPRRATTELANLRARLLADPYFHNVPSLQPKAQKTAVAFHACKDLQEVRRDVFRLLPSFGVKVQVAIRRKSVVARNAKLMQQLSGNRVTENSIYDDLVKRLFKNLLHKADNRITFARRGKSDRQAALQKAIDKARRNFMKAWGVQADHQITILSTTPSESAGLQVVDYYLWALQRMYERGEDRFFNLLAQDFRLIMDLDDTRNKPYGEWYSKSNPLTLEKIKPVAG